MALRLMPPHPQPKKPPDCSSDRGIVETCEGAWVLGEQQHAFEATSSEKLILCSAVGM